MGSRISYHNLVGRERKEVDGLAGSPNEEGESSASLKTLKFLPYGAGTI